MSTEIHNSSQTEPIAENKPPEVVPVLPAEEPVSTAEEAPTVTDPRNIDTAPPCTMSPDSPSTADPATPLKKSFFAGRSKKWYAIFFSGCAAAVALIVALALIISTNRYSTGLRSVAHQMYSSASTAEDVCILTAKVWYNSIHEEYDTETDPYTRKNGGSGRFYDDFNDALANLFADTDYVLDCLVLESSQSGVTEKVKELSNPPKKYAAAYSLLQALYGDYMELVDCAIDPSGSYNSYTEKYRGTIDSFIKNYNMLEMYLG